MNCLEDAGDQLRPARLEAGGRSSRPAGTLTSNPWRGATATSGAAIQRSGPAAPVTYSRRWPLLERRRGTATAEASAATRTRAVAPASLRDRWARRCRWKRSNAPASAGPPVATRSKVSRSRSSIIAGSP